MVVIKKLIFAAILFCNYIVAGQDMPLDKDFFKNKLTNFKINHPHFADFEAFRLFKQVQIQQQSVLLLRPSEFADPYNQVQPIGYRMKKIPEKIDYDNLFMQCGPLQPRNSEDMMIRAIKNYVINKYVIGLFLPTIYDD